MGGVISLSIIIGCLTSNIKEALPGALLPKIYTVSLFPYLWMFVISAFIAEYKGFFLHILKAYWWSFIIFVLIRRFILHWDIYAPYPLFDTIALFCGLVGWAYSFPQININTDISYGIYIYHMIVVNAFIVLGFTGQRWTLLGTIIVTFFLSLTSTVYIGKFSVNRKKTLYELNYE